LFPYTTLFRSPQLVELEPGAAPDLAGHRREPPRARHLAEERPRRRALLVGRRHRLPRVEPGDPLQRVAHPGEAGEVRIEVEVAVRDDVEAGALLLADDDRDRVEQLLPV